jgi:hypothetical protein
VKEMHNVAAFFIAVVVPVVLPLGMAYGLACFICHFFRSKKKSGKQLSIA